jgi:hypothetical protein
MTEHVGQKPHDVVSEENNTALEAAFTEKLKAAELYSAPLMYHPILNEMVNVEAEGGCRVYSISKLRKAISLAGNLPHDQARTLLENEHLRQIEL